MSVSAQEIRNKALRKLGLLRFGETARSEYAEDLDAAYTEVFAELEAEQISAWHEDADVPDEFVRPLVTLCAYARIADYNIPDRRANRIAAEAGPNGDYCKAEIRGLRDGKYIYKPVEYLDY